MQRATDKTTYIELIFLICRYLNLAKNNKKTIKNSQAVATLNFVQRQICYFYWTLKEMDTFALIKGK